MIFDKGRRRIHICLGILLFVFSWKRGVVVVVLVIVIVVILASQGGDSGA
jgi:hypothetical protein